MIAFDTDVLTELLCGNAAIMQRAALVPPSEQTVPIVVIEEILRGRLSTIRRAESGKGSVKVDRAYELLQLTVRAFAGLNILPYTSEAESIFRGWKRQKVRLSTHDVRIAAICVAHSTKLISRNRRDFERIPKLNVEFWE